MSSPSFTDIVATPSLDVPPPEKLVFPLTYHLGLTSSSLDLLHQSARRAGKPAIYFSDEEHTALLKPLASALILKFQRLHPKMDDVREALSKVGFKGLWSVGQLDPRHLLIRFTKGEDYTLMFTRRSCAILEQTARIIKWTPDFDSRKESPIAPVWLKFPNLKAHYFNHRVLFSLAAAFGKPMKLDQATYQFTRPSCARVLVELDITASYAKEIWIGNQTVGYWQEVIMEGIPYYCKYCCIFGHTVDNCYHANPELQSKRNLKQPQQPIPFPSKAPHSPTHSSGPANTFMTAGNPTVSQQPPFRPLYQPEPITITDLEPNPSFINPEHHPLPSEPDKPSNTHPILNQSPHPDHPETSNHYPQPNQYPTIQKPSKPCHLDPSQNSLETATPLPAITHQKQFQHSNHPTSEDEEASRNSEDDTYSQQLLSNLEAEINDGWTNVQNRRRKPKGTRELNSLLREAMNVSNTSSKRATRGNSGHHSS